ncbi:DUF3467 domain-containing protein [Candidatus Altiarchaeota archaeon]
MTTKKEKIDVKVVRDLQYREHSINGVYGGFTPDGNFRILCHNQNMMPSGNAETSYLERSLKCSLVMSPATLKSLLKWMKSHLEHYEERHGDIKFEESKEILEEQSEVDPNVR